MEGSADRSGFEAIGPIAKRYEPDRYLAALLAPAAVRGDLMALAAFAGEIARIPDSVSEPLLGEMRLQWWRDAISDSSKDLRTGSPVADALGGAIRRYDLPQDWFDGTIAAAQAALYRQPPEDDAGLIEALKSSQGRLFGLAAQVLGAGKGLEPDVGKDLSQACDSAGICYGLARLMQTLPRQLAHGYVPLPKARIEGHGIDVKALAAGEMSEPVARLLAGLREDARNQLGTARRGLRRLPRPLIAAFLPLAMVEPYLRAQERLAGNPLVQDTDVLPLARTWRILLSSVKRRV